MLTELAEMTVFISGEVPERRPHVIKTCAPVSALAGACSHAVYTPKSREAGSVYTPYVIEGVSFSGDVQLRVYSRDGGGRGQCGEMTSD